MPDSIARAPDQTRTFDGSISERKYYPTRSSIHFQPGHRLRIFALRGQVSGCLIFRIGGDLVRNAAEAPVRNALP